LIVTTHQHSVARKLTTFAHGLAVNFFKAAFVDEGAPDVVVCGDNCALAVEFQHIAVFDQDHVFFFVAEMVLINSL
jgi:hypothetical protein